MAQQAKAKRPEHEIRSGALKATLWSNPAKHGPMYSVRLVRVYKDSDGSWKETSGLGRDDLLLAAKMLDQMHTVLMRKECDDRQNRQGQDAGASAEA